MKHDPFADLEPLVQRVYAYVAYRVGEGPEAERVTAATFDLAFRYRAAFDPRQDDPLLWLVALARRTLADRHLPELAPGGYLDLRGAVETLAKEERELLALRYGAELSPVQMAAVLELEPAAVEEALRSALARLRQGTVLVV